MDMKTVYITRQLTQHVHAHVGIHVSLGQCTRMVADADWYHYGNIDVYYQTNFQFCGRGPGGQWNKIANMFVRS